MKHGISGTMVGDMVLSRVLGNQDVTVPEDFGTFVTAQNVDDHLQRLRQQMQEYLKRKESNNYLYS